MSDLSSVRVGVPAGTSAEGTLTRLRISNRTFATLQDGFKALRAGTIDALVHDRPLLAWAIREDPSSSIELVDATFGPQNYAFAIPQESPFRESSISPFSGRRTAGGGTASCSSISARDRNSDSANRVRRNAMFRICRLPNSEFSETLRIFGDFESGGYIAVAFCFC
jgi:Bacterial extracellular solute-binding proteins, family 3